MAFSETDSHPMGIGLDVFARKTLGKRSIEALHWARIGRDLQTFTRFYVASKDSFPLPSADPKWELPL